MNFIFTYRNIFLKFLSQLRAKICIRYVILTLLAFFISEFSFAQNVKYDSLVNYLGHANVYTSQINKLLKISEECLNNYTKKSLLYSKASLLLSKKINYTDGIIQSYINMGAAYYETGDFNGAVLNFNAAIEKCILNNDFKGLATCYINVGNIMQVQSNYIQALSNYYKSLKINEALGDKFKTAYCLGNIGVIHKRLGNWDKAEKYYMRSLDINVMTKDTHSIAYNYLNLGSIEGEKKNYSNALVYFKNAAKIGKVLKDYKVLAFAYNGIGSVYSDRRELDKGLYYYDKSLFYKKAMGNIQGIAFSYVNMGRIYLLKGEYNKTIELANKAIKIAEKLDAMSIKQDAYFNLSKAYDSLGMRCAAFQYYKLYTNIKDSLLSKETASRILDMENNFETEKNEKEIKYFQNQYFKQALLVESEKEKQRYQLILLLSVIAIVLIYSRYVLLRNRFKQKEILNLTVLQNKKEQLHAVIEAQDIERARFARDLHDGIGQFFSILKLRLTNLIGNDEEKIIKIHEQKELIRIIDDLYVEIRNISFNIMPQIISLNGLVAGVEELVRRINAAGIFEVKITAFGMEKRLPFDVELALYRVIQELLNNIIKYSGASNVSIQFTKNLDVLNILIEDDGKGFDVKKMKHSAGHGWKNIKSRIEMINASIDFDSELGKKGNTVNINLPV